ncbi:hypothetical protein JXI42_10430 [bacterium]|nr:hypothetical protein [bacterium]
MSRIIAYFLFSAGMLVFVFFNTGYSQNITSLYFTSEEEIEEALNQEEITYTEYQILIELVRDKVNLNSDEVDRLLDVPGVTRDEVFKIYEIRNEFGFFKDIEDFIEKYPYDYEQIVLFVIVETPRERELEGRLKYYTSNKFEYDYWTGNYVNGNFSREHVEVGFRIIQKGFNPLKWSSRYIEWELDKGKLILGSYYYGWAQGVLTGRFPYITSAIRDNISSGESFLYPIGNEFNGLKWEYDFGLLKPGLMLSYKKFDNISTGVASGNLTLNVMDNMDVGICLMGSNVKNSDVEGDNGSFVKSGGSIFLDGKIGSFSYNTESAILDDGEYGTVLNVYQRKDKISNKFSFWNYGYNFNNPYSSGISNSGYIVMELDSTEIDFHNRQAGETGCSFSSKIPVIKILDFKWQYEYWVFKPEDEPSSDFALTFYLKPSNKFKTNFNFDYLRKHITGELYQFESYRTTTTWEIKEKYRWYLYSNYRRRFYPEYKEYTWLTTKLRWDLTSHIILEPSIKCYDGDLAESEDTYLEFALKHSIVFGFFDLYFDYKYKHHLYDEENDLYIKAGAEYRWK